MIVVPHIHYRIASIPTGRKKEEEEERAQSPFDIETRLALAESEHMFITNLCS